MKYLKGDRTFGLAYFLLGDGVSNWYNWIKDKDLSQGLYENTKIFACDFKRRDESLWHKKQRP